MPEQPEQRAGRIVELSGVVHGTGSLRGELTVGEVVRRVQDADLSEDRLLEILPQIDRSTTPEAFAEANPDVAAIVGDLVRTHGVQALKMLLAVLAVLIPIYLGLRQIELAEQQVDLARQQLRQDERQDRRPAARPALTDDDLERIGKLVHDEMERHSTERPRPPREHDSRRRP